MAGGDLLGITIELGIWVYYNLGMMGIKRIVIGVLAACALCLASEGPVQTGVVIPAVQCKGAEGQSFALYVPTYYTKERAWPILFAFDPMAKGVVPVELFSRAAERYGYIVVGSNNSKNGPREPVWEAMNSVWQEAHRLFNIDKGRVYVTGFSGGSRVSTFFYNVVRSPVAGIIACGAGLSKLVTPQRLASTLYYGIIGTADYNYQEMANLDKLLDKAGVTHSIKVFEGPHIWPPEDLCLQAVQWMEIQAVKQKKAEADEERLREIFSQEMARAEGLDKEGKIVMAASAYQSILNLFPEPATEAGVEQAVLRLQNTKYYKKFPKLEKKRMDKELAVVGNFFRVLGFIQHSPPTKLNGQQLLFQLKVGSLKKMARRKDIYESGLGKRQLYNLSVQARNLAERFHQGKEYLKAILMYKMALEAGIESPYRSLDLYNLACAYAGVGQKKNALKNLNLAADEGFKRFESLETEADLDAIRGEAEFAKIAAKIKQNQVH
jgi:dienelactone hydrolase